MADGLENPVIHVGNEDGKYYIQLYSNPDAYAPTSRFEMAFMPDGENIVYADIGNFDAAVDAIHEHLNAKYNLDFLGDDYDSGDNIEEVVGYI